MKGSFWIGLGIFATAVAVAVIPGLPGHLEFVRGSHESWSLLTAQFAHFGWGHLLTDGLAVVLLAWMLDASARTTLGLAVGATLTVGLAIAWAAPDIAVYRGLSGIAHAFAGAWLAQRTRQGSKLHTLAFLALLAHLTWLLATGTSPIGTSLPQDVHIATQAHAAGLAVGLGWGLMGRNERRGRRGFRTLSAAAT